MGLKSIDPKIVEETQIWMAEQIAKLHTIFRRESNVDLWIIGMSQLKPGGLFEQFAQTLQASYNPEVDIFNWHVYVFKHFSYGHFFKDYQECVAISASIVAKSDADCESEYEDEYEDEDINDIEAEDFVVDYNANTYILEDTYSFEDYIDNGHFNPNKVGELLPDNDCNEEDDDHDFDPDEDDYKSRNSATILMRLIGGGHALKIFKTKNWKAFEVIGNDLDYVF